MKSGQLTADAAGRRHRAPVAGGVVPAAASVAGAGQPAVEPLEAVESGRTRQQVMRTIVEEGPQTAAALASRFALTPAAVRRHLEALVAAGLLESCAPREHGPRGRGRPARAFRLTTAGRSAGHQAYDTLAREALGFLAATQGPAGLAAFAQAHAAPIEQEYRRALAAGAPPGAATLAAVLSERGYAASVEPVQHGEQLCQHHCPVAHVAAAYPELCEAETQLFARLLGRPVQRLATIAHGDGVCTTHVSGPIGAIRSAGSVGPAGPAGTHQKTSPRARGVTPNTSTGRTRS